jgi:hypothetical protein
MTIKGSFKVDVFDCSVHVVIAKSIMSSVNYHLRKAGYKQEDFLHFEPSGFFCNPTPDRIGNYYIFFQESDLTVDVVNHEKSHLVEHILTDRDIEPKDEVRCYLDGYISRMIDLFFKSRKIKIKNKRDNTIVK